MSTGAGGQTSNIAAGIIRINLAPLRGDSEQAKRLFADISRSGSQMGTGVQQGVRQAQSSLQSLRGTLTDVAKQFAGVFAVGAMTKVTQDIAKTNALVVALSKNEEDAAKKLQALRDLADRTNQPFNELVASSTMLLPAIGRTNVDLAQTVALAQRLAILDPIQGVEGASVAIRELLSGSYTSLAARFEMSRTELKALLADASGDPQKIIDGLDGMVARMGLTNEKMEEMGESGANSFGVIRSEVQSLTATGFAPFLNNALIPITKEFTRLIRLANDSNKELVTVAGTMLGIVASAKALQAVGLGAGAGQLGILGAAAYAGTQIGVAGARYAANRGVGDQRLAGASQSEAGAVLWDTFKQMIVVAGDSLAKLIAMLDLGRVTLGNAWERTKIVFEMGVVGAELAFVGLSAMITEAGVSLQNAFASVLTGLGEFLDGIPGLKGKGEELKRAGENLRAEQQPVDTQRLDELLTRFGELNEAMQSSSLAPTEGQTAEVMARYEEMQKALVGGLMDLLFPQQTATTPTEPVTAAGRAAAENGFSEEQVQAWVDFQKELKAVDEQAQAERLAAEADYQKNLARVQQDWRRTLTREAEDEARRRRDAETRLGRSIETARRGGAQKEQELQEGHQETLSDLATNHQADEVKRQKDHYKTLRDQEKDLRRSLSDAARSLDAGAAWDAILRFRRQREDARENYDEETSERAGQLQEKLALEREEHQVRLAENQNQTQERITNLREQFVQEEAANAEQRAFKLQRMTEDHQLELAQMAQDQAERIAQINQQAVQERQEKQRAFIELYNNLAQQTGQGNAILLRMNQDYYNQQALMLGAFIRNQQALLNSSMGAPRQSRIVMTDPNQRQLPGTRVIPSFDSGGDINRDQIAQVHQGEHMINRANTNFLKTMLPGSGALQERLVSAFQGGGRAGANVQVGSIPISVTNAGNRSDGEIKDIFLQSLEEFFDRWQ